MKIFAVILGILVICAWLFVMNEYKKGTQKKDRAKILCYWRVC